ncbi:MAG: ABC transporter substrate-binding protein [Burkholderiaceae bacterium]|nr:ABC transporter substrate-binding protein [Burkholderiaceae bacterium]
MKFTTLIASLTLVAVQPLFGGAALAQEVVKIGVAQVFEGPSGYYGDAALKGMQVALDMLNERDAFKGKKIVFVTEETQGKPPVATAAVRKLAQQADILAIVGPTRSIEAIAAAPIANQAMIPMIAQASGGKWPQPPGPWVFKLAMPAYENGPVLQAVAERTKAKTMSVMYDLDDEAALSALEDVKVQAQRLNIRIVATEAHRGTDIDMSGQISRIRAANPDIFYYASKAETGGLIIRTARERGIKAPIVAWGAPGGIEKTAKEATEGVISQSALDAASPDPLMRDFVARYAKRFGAGAKIDHYHGYGFDAMLLLADAMGRAGAKPTRQSLRDAIASTKNLRGVTGTLSWSGSEVSRSSAAVVVMQGGNWVSYK